MENEVGILSKQYVCEHGIDFDEKLWFVSYSDEVLDNPEDEGENPLLDWLTNYMIMEI